MSWSLRRGLSSAVEAIDDGRYGPADEILSGILEKTPDAVEALIHRAFARHRAGRLADARLDAERACQLRPESGVFQMILGEILISLRENELAYQSLRKAVSLEKDNGRALFHLGRACIATSRTAEAGDYFESALQFERDYVMSQWMVETFKAS